ncbi:MAG: nucleotidyltransferase substrate binding protein [Endomicrobia bacterium]|nr:nucleotidyltransferase substrate binding protein [Endomicrobiia bacterium]MCL2506250.1 nucleotidyltransferase substrate binding protein [Endomicrobiia bacterium]
MTLDLSSLKKAVTRLKEVLIELEKDNANKFIKDAAIQRFEYTYELSYKMLRRFLEIDEHDKQEIKEMGFANIIRTASQRGLLLNDLEKWLAYREKRNITSHVYDENKADDVISVIPDFLKEAEFLLKKLSERSNNI